MKPNYRLQLTLGQTAFLVVCLLAGGFLDFYLGARFGPELLWGIRVDRLAQEGLLPKEPSEEELEALLREEGNLAITFHAELEKKGNDVQPLPVLKEVPVDIPTDSPVAPKIPVPGGGSLSDGPALAEVINDSTEKSMVKEGTLLKSDKKPLEELKADNAALPTPELEKPKGEALKAEMARKEEVKKDKIEKAKKETPVLPPPHEDRPRELLSAGPEGRDEPVPVEVVKDSPAEKSKIEPEAKEKLQDQEDPEVKEKSKVKLEVKEEPQVKEVPEVQDDEPAPSSSRYTLQVGSFSSKKQAKDLEEKCRALGLPVSVKSEDLPNKGTWFRVRVGPYQDEEEAESAKKRIQQSVGVTSVLKMI